MNIVKHVLEEVRVNGDTAIKKYTKQFDRIELETLEMSRKQIREAYEKVDAEVVSALKAAADNIAFFAERQLAQLKDFEVSRGGVLLAQKVIPLGRVGCYVPGGNYPLASTALMCAIPAKVAGVDEVIICSPKITPVTIVAADLAGADRIFSIGGVQAIGAMAYGTETVPKVDKIVGPGNKYVTAAKKEVYGIVGIDLIAGPSEAMIIADETANPDFIAADLLAQLEHGADAKACLVTISKQIADKVRKHAGKAVFSVVKSLEHAVEIANASAPEHLSLQVENPKALMNKLKNYGSLFIGPYSAIAFGDYCSGTNHVLPTNGAARYTGGLSARDFVKIVTYQEVTKQEANELAAIASAISSAEGMERHRKSAIIRKTY